ncbi:ATP-binding protein [Rugamonas sp.]|uniref:ATP-binding protein n=1 Tax=Rugamonas sp. TaxID=1926287 RepID=UPI0025EEE31D|nr:ATP-binding protein [Rugamonas sp.]
MNTPDPSTPAQAQPMSSCDLRRLHRLAIMIDSVSDAIVTIDALGIIEYVNRGATALFGYTREEMLGQNVALLMPPPDSAHHDQYIAAYIKSGQSRVMNHSRSVIGKRKGGDDVAIDLTLGQMVEDGQQKFTAILRDVTQSRRLQNEAALAEKRMQEAKDRADEANRAKSVFLATMSHEIRTPMNGVLGSLELLGLSSLSADQKDTLSIAETSARELLQILDDILDFSKIEAGHLALRHEKTSLRDHVVSKVVATYAPLALKKGLQLRTRVDPRVSEAVCTDPLRLRQILHNFVSNAIKFTLAGFVELSLDVLDISEEKQKLRFTVTDTGIGISEESQKRLFRPFVQAENDTTRRFGGTGLGLAICAGLSDSMGGTIEMSSTVGVGTSLSLTVSLLVFGGGDLTEDQEPCLVDLAAQEVGVARPSAPLPTLKEAVARQQLILVVDDHATNRTVIARQLNSLGYVAESAANGIEAIDMLASGNFSLVITDCQMPEMDGYALARAVRVLEGGDNGDGRRPGARRPGAPGPSTRLPIIGCSANAFASDVALALEAGMDDYLTKPTTIASLAAMLKKFMPHQGAVLDERLLAATFGSDEGTRDEVLADFLATTQDDFIALRHACQEDEWAGVGLLAHRISGASKMVGATRMAAASVALEQLLRKMSPSASATDKHHLGGAVQAMEAELGEFKSYLEQGPVTP